MRGSANARPGRNRSSSAAHDAVGALDAGRLFSTMTAPRGGPDRESPLARCSSSLSRCPARSWAPRAFLVRASRGPVVPEGAGSPAGRRRMQLAGSGPHLQVRVHSGRRKGAARTAVEERRRGMTRIRGKSRWLLMIGGVAVAATAVACQSSPDRVPAGTGGVSPVVKNAPSKSSSPGDPVGNRPPAPPAPPKPSRCHTADLAVEVGQSDSGTGRTGLNLALVNRSTHPCQIYGYGGIQLLDAAGAAVPTRQVRGGPAPQPIMLRPGVAPTRRSSGSSARRRRPTPDRPSCSSPRRTRGNPAASRSPTPCAGTAGSSRAPTRPRPSDREPVGRGLVAGHHGCGPRPGTGAGRPVPAAPPAGRHPRLAAGRSRGCRPGRRSARRWRRSCGPARW